MKCINCGVKVTGKGLAAEKAELPEGMTIVMFKADAIDPVALEGHALCGKGCAIAWLSSRLDEMLCIRPATHLAQTDGGYCREHDCQEPCGACREEAA